jgi:hypothetical protein
MEQRYGLFEFPPDLRFRVGWLRARLALDQQEKWMGCHTLRQAASTFYVISIRGTGVYSLTSANYRAIQPSSPV